MVVKQFFVLKSIGLWLGGRHRRRSCVERNMMVIRSSDILLKCRIQMIRLNLVCSGPGLSGELVVI